MTVMNPVDIIWGADLTRRQDIVRLRAKIEQWRPLQTHISPMCRSFSRANTIKNTYEYQQRNTYQQDLALAANVCQLAFFIHSLMLFVSVENPLGSSLFLLRCYKRLHMMGGFSMFIYIFVGMG